MTTSIGYRLLTSGGPWAALVLLVLDVGVVAQSRSAWRGDALWGIQLLGASLLIGLPVVLVALASPAVLRGGAGSDRDLMPVRPLAAGVGRWLVDVIPVLVVHLGFVAFALAYTTTHGDPLSWPSIALSVALQILAIACVGALGRAVGEVIGHPVAVLAAALAGVLFSAFAANALRVSAGNSAYAGLEIVPGEYLIAAGVLAAATAAFLMRPRQGRAGVLVVTGGLAGILVAGQLLDEPDLRTSGAAASTCRPVAAVSVCVFPGYAFMADGLVAQTDRSLSMLAEQGIDAHLELVTQSVPGQLEAPGEVAIAFDERSLSAGSVTAAMVRGSLLHPGWCPRINSPEVLPAWFDRDQRNTYHWLEHAEGASTDQDYLLAVPEFARLPEPRQAALVQEFFDGNLACTGLS